MEKTIKEIENKAKEYFKGSDGCHDWSHVERVRDLSLKIGKKEKANLNILTIASLLHDIGRKEETIKKGKACHAEIGKKIAESILKKYNNISEEDKNNILHCIITHRFRNNNRPETIEAKVLFDSDKLDSIGAIGLARVFAFAGGEGGSGYLYTGNEKEIASLKEDRAYTEDDSAMLEYEIKLKRIKNLLMTKTGREIAKSRDDFMKVFVKRFWEEVKGKK